jgi:hypothetical protein
MNDVIPATNSLMTDYGPQGVVQAFSPGPSRGDVGTYFSEVAIEELAGNWNIGKAVTQPRSIVANLEQPYIKAAVTPGDAKGAASAYRKLLQGQTEGQVVSIIA